MDTLDVLKSVGKKMNPYRKLQKLCFFAESPYFPIAVPPEPDSACPRSLDADKRSCWCCEWHLTLLLLCVRNFLWFHHILTAGAFRADSCFLSVRHLNERSHETLHWRNQQQDETHEFCLPRVKQHKTTVLFNISKIRDIPHCSSQKNTA